MARPAHPSPATRWLAIWLVVGTMPMAVAAAQADPLDALVPVDGQLRWPTTPASVAGVLTVAVPQGPGSGAMVTLPAAVATSTELLRSDAALFRIIEHRVGGIVPSAHLPLIGSSGEPQLLNGTLLVEAVRDRPQAFLVGGMRHLAGHLEGGPVQCEIRNPGVTLAFPEDPKRAGAAPLAVARAERTIEADCRMPALSARNPLYTYLYGLDLVHIGPGGRETRFQTGTFSEGPGGGLVTRVLRVELDGRPIVAQVPADSVRIRAGAFQLVGRIDVQAAHGTLSFGEERLSGDIERWSSEGSLRLGWAVNSFVEVNGQAWGVKANVDYAGPRHFLLLAAAGSVVAAGTLAFAWRIAFGLFTTLVPEKVLRHPRRQMILEMVRAQPGIEMNSIAKALGLRWANLAHHVGKLAHSGFVVVHAVGGRRCVFATGSGCRGREAGIALLRRDTVRRVHEILLANPFIPQAEIAARLGFSQQRVSQVIGALEKAQLVQRVRAGRKVQYLAQPAPLTGHLQGSVPTPPAVSG